jgi:protein-disulfide isomerase
VHVFSDFECPFCEEVQPTLEQLDAEFPGKLRFIWHNLPLPLHSQARALARASLEAFAEQGNPGFWRIHDFLWKTPDPSPEGVRRYAREHHFDEARFEQALAGTRHDAEIDRDIALAHEHGITATPSFVINGVLVVGAQPIEEFREVVQLALDLHQ